MLSPQASGGDMHSPHGPDSRSTDSPSHSCIAACLDVPVPPLSLAGPPPALRPSAGGAAPAAAARCCLRPAAG